MFSRFFNLEKEKQDRIVNAAIKEFAQKGYERASTNEIVKEATISKGLLFHYFQNKKQLYIWLYDYCIDTLVQEFFGKIDLTETDFFLRIRQAVLIKMELLNQYPHIFRFVESAYIEDANEVKEELHQKKKGLTEIHTNNIFEGIDISRFRDDIDLQKTFKIIMWTFEQFGEEELQKAKQSPSHEIDYEQSFSAVNEYLDIFVKCFYK